MQDQASGVLCCAVSTVKLGLTQLGCAVLPCRMDFQALRNAVDGRCCNLLFVSCCVLQGGRWVIFNDEKVAASEHPPLSMGYMYFYRRIGDSTPAQQQ